MLCLYLVSREAKKLLNQIFISLRNKITVFNFNSFSTLFILYFEGLIRGLITCKFHLNADHNILEIPC